MIKKNTWIFLTILVLLAAFVWASRQPENPLFNWLAASGAASPNQTESFLPNTKTDFTEISLQTPADGKVRLYWKEDVWYVEKYGLTSPAPSELVLAVIGQITNLQILNHLNDAKLQETGLLSPTYTLDISFFDGTKRNLKIGNLTPINTGYFAQTEQELIIVEKYGVEQLIKMLVSTQPTAQP